MKSRETEKNREHAADPHRDESRLGARKERAKDAAEDAPAVKGEAREKVEAAKHEVEPHEIHKRKPEPVVLDREEEKREKPNSREGKRYKRPRERGEKLLPRLAREGNKRGTAAKKRNRDVGRAIAKEPRRQGVAKLV